MIELRLICEADGVDELSDALMELGALSVSVEDFDAATENEVPLFGEPGMAMPRWGWNRSRMCALFENDEALAQAELGLGELVRLSEEASLRFNIEGRLVVQDQDWVRLTQSQFNPVSVTESFWIVPTWSEVPKEAKTVIRLDPGLAFGTGTHPTTFMCLQWLASNDLRGKDLLDYGCGSGILAIASKKLGAGQVVGVDIDPCSIAATGANAAFNQVAVELLEASKVAGEFDVVVANILAGPLMSLAGELVSYACLGGRLLLSGILKEQASELAAVYQAYLSLEVIDEVSGWVLMTGEKARA